MAAYIIFDVEVTDPTLAALCANVSETLDLQ